MKEQRISFKTAVLAQQKGFRIPSLEFYSDDSPNKRYTYGYYEDWFDTQFDEHNATRYNASSQTILQKWLRDEYNIHIELKKNIDGYSFIVYPDHELNEDYWLNYISDMADKDIRQKYLYNTYEKALEKGLRQALKLLK